MARIADIEIIEMPIPVIGRVRSRFPLGRLDGASAHEKQSLLSRSMADFAQAC